MMYFALDGPKKMGKFVIRDSLVAIVVSYLLFDGLVFVFSVLGSYILLQTLRLKNKREQMSQGVNYSFFGKNFLKNKSTSCKGEFV